MLSLQDVHSYYGDSHILQGVSLTMGRNQCVAILGRNGAGKTTTLRTIVGLTRAWRGRITFNGRDIGLDDIFFKDFCTLAGWMRENGLMKEQFNLKEFIWIDGLEAVNPKLVGTVPPPC